MKVAAFVQARMGSTRLPGKVMLPLQDKTVLGHVITRLQHSSKPDEIVILTSDLVHDTCIVEEAKKYQVSTFQGSEQNVLKRFYEAARNYHPNVIVRITADCPMMDPIILDQMLQQFLNQPTLCDYMSNTIVRTFPRGLDVEIFTIQALEQAYHNAQKEEEKEHVTPYLYRHPEQFRLLSYTNQKDYSKYRWTLDTQQDWTFIQKVYSALYKKNQLFMMEDVIKLLEEQPELAKINQDVLQKEF